MSAPIPPRDEKEPFAPREHYAFSGGFFAPSTIESPLGQIIAGVVVIVVGPVFGFALWAVAPQPRPAAAAIFGVVATVLFIAIGVFAVYVGSRRRAWRRERGLPPSGRLDPPPR